MNAAMKGTPSGRFLGVNLRQDRVSLADSEVAKAINADFHSQPGVIVLRLGRTALNANALSDLIIRRMATINSILYRVAGRSVYANETVKINGTLSTNLITTMQAYRPLNDTVIWNFIADDAGMHKISTTSLSPWGSQGTWGLPAPDDTADPDFSAAPTAWGGIDGNLTGEYVAQYTYARRHPTTVAVVAEGNPSDVTSQVDSGSALSAQALGIGDMLHPEDTSINALGVYRSVAGSTVCLLDAYMTLPPTGSSLYTVTYTWEVTTQSNAFLYFHWSVNLGVYSLSVASTTARGTQTWEINQGYRTETTNGEDASGYHGTHRWEIVEGHVTTQTIHWAYPSTIADSALGAVVEVDNGVPPNASWVTLWQEHLWLTRDASNQHHLYFSKRFRPESFPADNYIEIGNPDDPLQCAVPIGGQLGVFARKMKYRLIGNAVSGFTPIEAASPRGTPAPMAVIPTEEGIVFVARDGIFSTFLASPDVELSKSIMPLFFGETVNDMAPLNWTYATLFSAAVYKGRYYLSYVDTTSTTPNRVAVFSRETGNWYFYEHPLASLYVDEGSDYLLGGAHDGFVYILENGATDNGSSIALDVETKDFEGQEGRDVRKLFQHLKLNTNTGGANITVKFYVDDTLKHTVTVTTSTRQETLLPLPQHVMGHHWRVKFTYTGSTRIRIYSCAALYLPLAVA